MNLIKPAIVVVGYNRPEAIKRLLISINNAYYMFDDIPLFVSIDECELSNEVEKVVRDMEWKHGDIIIRRFKNRQGLRRHIIQCGDLSEKYGAVIILEDDLVVSPSFYQFTYEAVNFYRNNQQICGISLYSHAWNGYAGISFMPMQNQYDVYMGQFSISWGQCWTAAQWKSFKEWYAENENKLPKENFSMPSNILTWNDQSWGKYFASYLVEKNLYYIIPYVSMSTNFSEAGQHCSQSNATYQVSLLVGLKRNYLFPEVIDAVKYDIFFERIFDNITIAEIDGNDICVNLNSSKLSTLTKRYLLSTEKLKYKKITSFAMTMRPIDANIVNNIEGDDIYLYDCEGKNLMLTSNRLNWKSLNYVLYGYWWKRLLREGKRRLVTAIIQKIGRLRRRRTK